VRKATADPSTSQAAKNATCSAQDDIPFLIAQDDIQFLGAQDDCGVLIATPKSFARRADAKRIHDSSGETALMHAWRNLFLVFFFFAMTVVLAPTASAAPRKAHTAVLGAAKKVPYSKAGDPSGAAAGEDSLKVRALFVDGVLKEWTTGDAHDVTDRSFVVRRVIRLNDALPTDKPTEKPAANSTPNSAQSPAQNSAVGASHWVWQRGPWLLVDKATGHVTALHLPDYDPGVSQVSWFRDYAAYCGVTASGKSLYAVVVQLAARRPVLAKRLSAFDPEKQPAPACAPPDWQREPLRINFHPTGTDAVSFEIVPGSAVLVEDTGDDEETAAPAAAK
jgi:hypothetical protein